MLLQKSKSVLSRVHLYKLQLPVAACAGHSPAQRVPFSSSLENSILKIVPWTKLRVLWLIFPMSSGSSAESEAN